MSICFLNVSEGYLSTFLELSPEKKDLQLLLYKKEGKKFPQNIFKVLRVLFCFFFKSSEFLIALTACPVRQFTFFFTL